MHTVLGDRLKLAAVNPLSDKFCFNLCYIFLMHDNFQILQSIHLLDTYKKKIFEQCIFYGSMDTKYLFIISLSVNLIAYPPFII